MKTKFLLSVATLALFAACSDDSSNPATAENTVPAADSTVTDPATVDPSQTQTDPTQIDPNQTQTDPAQTDPNQAQTDPAQTDPTQTQADPTQTDPVTEPSIDPVTDPNTNPPAVEITLVDPTESVAACRSSARAPIVEPTYAAQGQGDEVKYYGAELAGKDQFKYGRFEACMKMVSIPGSVSSMFLYYDDSWRNGDEPWNEVDIEVLGKSQTSWQSNIITREGLESIKKNTTSEAIHQTEFDVTEDFHLYAIVWTPEFVIWEIDGVEIRRDVVGGKLHGKHADADQVAFLTETESLHFNLWAAKSTAWVGAFTGDELIDAPKAQWIDYVRVYSYDVATGTFAQEWQDDFDGTSLSEHWGIGTHTMEHVKLSRDNVVVEDGYCKMLMTRELE